jgi:hypothetical protein
MNKLIKSQVIVISRCRINIPTPTLLIGSDVIKVVAKVTNLGFVLNEGVSEAILLQYLCYKVTK